MAQSPLLIDQIDIEPGSAGTRRINRDSATGSLAFQDALITTPLTLSQLAGLRNITNVLVVGKSGAGAQYITIQSALDVVPSSASATNPYIVLVLPGRYDETINIVRDGVRLIGIGKPEIRSALETTPDAGGNDHTIIISAQQGTIPLSTLIQGFTISNVHTNKTCVRVIGGAASTVGSGGIEIRDCDLNANSAAGNRNIWATACGVINAYGGNWSEAADLGLLLLEEVTWFTAIGVSSLGALSLRYDTANDEPLAGDGAYRFLDCGPIADTTAMGTPVALDLDGGGVALFESCTLAVQVNFCGDRTFTIRNSIVDSLLLTETVVVVAENSVIKSLVAPSGTATFTTPVLMGSAVFGTVTQIDVTFDVTGADADYQVQLEMPSQPVNDESPWITNKATTGFRINFATNQTMTVEWRATRLL